MSSFYVVAAILIILEVSGNYFKILEEKEEHNEHNESYQKYLEKKNNNKR